MKDKGCDVCIFFCRVREASTGPLVKVKGENLESLDQRSVLQLQL